MSTLQHAFRRFEDAALSLQKTHATLQNRVDQLERQLMDAHRQLEAVVDAIDSGVAVVGASGELLRTNAAFRGMALERDGRLDPERARGLLDTGPDRSGSMRLSVEGDRGVRELVATFTPVGDDEATRVMTVLDTTEVRREEEEGGRRRRLEALGRMAAELAHEVRNPLGGIRLFATMLRDDLEDRPEQREMAEQILAAGAGLETTVTNLLAFASPAHGERREIDLAGLAREVAGMLGPACAVRGVALHAPSEEIRLPLTGDPESLRQILLNLVGNSLAATDEGGTILIGVDREGDRAHLEVTDDGKGIPGDDLPRVFDPFFTRTEGGTGLGLSIVQRLVESNGGRIRLDSRVGDGTRVVVDLPVEAQETLHV